MTKWRLWRAMRRAEPPEPCIMCDGPHPSMLCPQVKTGNPETDALWAPLLAPPAEGDEDDR